MDSWFLRFQLIIGWLYFCGPEVRQKSITEKSCSTHVSLEAKSDKKFSSKAYIGELVLQAGLPCRFYHFIIMVQIINYQ